MKKRILSLATAFFAVFSLTGCVETAVVGCTAAGGSIITDKRSIRTQIADQKLRQRVLAHIASDPVLKANTRINATVYNDVLLLIGQARSNKDKQQALDIASQSGDFKRIYNRIAIADPESFADISEDTWLTTKIKAAMLSERNLKSTQIKVVTENKTVYLLGLVDHKQGDLAATVARQIPGVNKIVKLFEYTS